MWSTAVQRLVLHGGRLQVKLWSVARRLFLIFIVLNWNDRAKHFRVCLPFLAWDPSELASCVPQENRPIQLICHKLTALL